MSKSQVGRIFIPTYNAKQMSKIQMNNSQYYLVSDIVNCDCPNKVPNGQMSLYIYIYIYIKREELFFPTSINITLSLLNKKILSINLWSKIKKNWGQDHKKSEKVFAVDVFK